MRPRGRPPQPSATSSPMEPVGMTLISGGASSAPSRMIDPLPNCFSIVLTASSIALSRGLPAPSLGGCAIVSLLLELIDNWELLMLPVYSLGLTLGRAEAPFGPYTIL